MKSQPEGVEASISTSLKLIVGDADEISHALSRLGASPSLIAQARSSFAFAKVPGATVRKVEGGYEIGGSFLEDKVSSTRGTTAKRVSRLITTNDEPFLKVA